MTRLLKAWGAGCAGELLLRLALGVVIGGSVACVIAGAALLPLSPDLEVYRPVILSVGLALIIGGVVVAAAAWAGWMLVRRKRQLDAAFTPLGLSGQLYLLNGRHYQGTVQGRQVDAWFYRGPALDLYVSASVATRLSITVSDRLNAAVAGALQRRPLVLSDPDLRQLQVFAHDETWGQTLLAVPAAVAAIRRLVTSQPAGGPFELRQLHVQPGAVYLTLYRTRVSQLTAGSAEAWLADLLTLAQTAESLLPPRESLSASSLELNTRTHRQALTGPIFAISCGVVAALGACTVLLVALALWSEGH